MVKCGFSLVLISAFLLFRLEQVEVVEGFMDTEPLPTSLGSDCDVSDDFNMYIDFFCKESRKLNV